MNDVFEGDVLLEADSDGFDIVLKNGLVQECVDFNTAIMISLFGGNKEDSGKVKNNKAWWGNLVGEILENEKVVSRFQNVINGLPFSLKNIAEAESAALLDLEWLKKEKLADSVFAEGRVLGRNNFVLKIVVKKDVDVLYEDEFPVLWKGEINGV